jgi:UDP-N-acetylmuramoyl-L-alanyl-D-glutamate--2,6-diaminopimelate ligase
MEMITYGTNSIFIDYAHTPDAVINVLNSTLEYKEGKVITIVGCGGNRDRTKRPIMGGSATKMSDYVIFTDDNPRDEEEQDIMNDILAGVTKDNYEVIYNRKEAIFKGMSLLKDKDILMVLGKGHEDYQIVKGVKHHLDDKECVLEYINSNK